MILSSSFFIKFALYSSIVFSRLLNCDSVSCYATVLNENHIGAQNQQYFMYPTSITAGPIVTSSKQFTMDLSIPNPKTTTAISNSSTRPRLPEVIFEIFKTDGNCQGDNRFYLTASYGFSSTAKNFKLSKVLNSDHDRDVVITGCPYEQCEGDDVTRILVPAGHNVCFNHEFHLMEVDWY